MMTRWQPRFASVSTCNPFEGSAGFRRMFDEPVGSSARGHEQTADEWKPLMDVGRDEGRHHAEDRGAGHEAGRYQHLARG